MKALVFPGQGAQFTGMGKDLFDTNDIAKDIFAQADEVLGYELSKVMFTGTSEELTQTNITQPAIFLHSIVKLQTAPTNYDYKAVAGHSLGEITALVASDCLDWKDGLRLVKGRALAMQSACEAEEGTMAAVLGLEDQLVEDICNEIDDVVIAANFNCPGQIVISGSLSGIEKAGEVLKEKGARRVLPLKVGGAFHSPLMVSAQNALEEAIKETTFNKPECAIYQNVDGLPTQDPDIIRKKLAQQLTSPVRWTQTMQNLVKDGFTSFIEVGGKGGIISGMFKKLDRSLDVQSL